jgi:hypothetical protein
MFRRPFVYFCAALTLLCMSAPAHADVRISGFTDLDFGVWSGSGNLVGNMSLCIYNSVAAETSYRITATSSQGAFQVVGGPYTLNYLVGFQGSSGGMSALTYGNTATFSSSSSVNNTCGGVPNATLRITFRDVFMAVARPARYSGTIIVLLEPPL